MLDSLSVLSLNSKLRVFFHLFLLCYYSYLKKKKVNVKTYSQEKDHSRTGARSGTGEIISPQKEMLMLGPKEGNENTRKLSGRTERFLTSQKKEKLL